MYQENGKCGPGCRCTGCMNTITQPSVADEFHDLEVDDSSNQVDNESVTDESDDAWDSQDELHEEVDTLMDGIFGDMESSDEL